MVSVWRFTLTFMMTFMMSVAWIRSLHGSNLKFFQQSFKLLQVHWFVCAIFFEQAVNKRFCSWSIYAPSVDMRENMTICRADKVNKAKKRESLPRAPWIHCKVVLLTRRNPFVATSVMQLSTCSFLSSDRWHVLHQAYRWKSLSVRAVI